MQAPRKMRWQTSDEFVQQLNRFYVIKKHMFNQINGYVREYPTKYGLNKATNVPPVEDPGQFPLIKLHSIFRSIYES